MAAKFYHCNVCGNVMAAVVPSGVVPYCCDSEMDELMSNTSDGAGEYHVPEVKLLEDNVVQVRVGKEFHPATSDHHICFIVVESDHGATIRYLTDIQAPEVVIHCDGCPKVVYAYCNKHGLWRKQLFPTCPRSVAKP